VPIHAYELRLNRVVAALERILEREDVSDRLRHQLRSVRNHATVRKLKPRPAPLPAIPPVVPAAPALADNPPDPLLAALRRASLAA
jgi:hypothetical protein